MTELPARPQDIGEEESTVGFNGPESTSAERRSSQSQSQSQGINQPDTSPPSGRPRAPTLRIPAFLNLTGTSSGSPSTMTNRTPITPSSPNGNNAPISPRRRAHTVSVSLRPRNAISASPIELRNQEIPLRSTILEEEHKVGEDETNLDFENHHRATETKTKIGTDGLPLPITVDTRRSRPRSSSLLGRMRDTMSMSGGNGVDRERRDSAEPVRFDVIREDGSHKPDELGDEVVGVLDCIDPQVSTVNHLQNMTNSILVPHFPALWSRRPEIVLGPSSAAHSRNEDTKTIPQTAQRLSSIQPRSSTITRPRSSTVAALFPSPCPLTRPTKGFPSSAPPASVPFVQSPAQADITTATSDPSQPSQPTRPRGFTSGKTLEPIKSASTSSIEDDIPHKIHPTKLQTTTSKSPLLPNKEIPESDYPLTPGEEHSLDTHIRQVLHKSKSQKLKEVGKGIWLFIKTPMGAITAIYGFLVAFWGAAIVLFLLGWINAGSKELNDIWVERSSQIENGLFTVTGVGLIPWRVVDTYRMVIIAKYKHRTRILRNKKGLPPIADANDLPDPKDQEDYVAVLSEWEQEELRVQQEKFAKSQTWYRPHATNTHTAFPITWALWNTILMDMNSVFQCMLCGCMWGLNRFTRPAWTTGSLIPLSFLCGIGAAVLIWQGSARTKKYETVEDKLRKALGVPLAIAMPNAKDTTTLKSGEESPLAMKLLTGEGLVVVDSNSSVEGQGKADEAEGNGAKGEIRAEGTGS